MKISIFFATNDIRNFKQVTIDQAPYSCNSLDLFFHYTIDITDTNIHRPINVLHFISNLPANMFIFDNILSGKVQKYICWQILH